MADDDQKDEATEGAAPPKGKRKLVMMGAGALLVLLLGGGGWFLFLRAKPDEQHAAAPPPPKPPVFMELPEVLSNLSTAPGERVQYLKVKIVIEVKDQALVAMIQPSMPRVMDIFQTYVRELRPGDLNGSVGLFRLKEEMTRRVNAAISPNQVNAVLFKEIVVQ